MNKVEPDQDADITHVTFDIAIIPILSPHQAPRWVWWISTKKYLMNKTNIQTWILNKWWYDKDLNAFLTWNEWDTDKLLDTVAEMRAAE